MTKRRAHGDGGIDQRGENSFRLRYRVNGRRLTRAFRGTLTEAKAELRALLRSGETGEHVAPDRMTLGGWVDAWVAAGCPGKKRRKVGARAIERYHELMRVHVLPALAARPLQKLQPTEIDALYLKLETKVAPRTAAHVHSVLNACLGAAVRIKLLVRNPIEFVTKIPAPGESDHGIALDETELKAFLKGFRDHPLFLFVSVAAFTGARRNEIVGLRWSDIDADRKEMRIQRAVEETKTHGLRFKDPKNKRSRRTIGIDDDLLAMLLAEKRRFLQVVAGVPEGADVDLSLVKLPADALVFPAPPEAGRAWSLCQPRRPGNLTKEFARRAAAIGFGNLRLHDLRGTHETLLLDRGVPVHVVAARCGHDPAVLLRSYAKRTKKADTSATAVIAAISRGILA